MRAESKRNNHMLWLLHSLMVFTLANTMASALQPDLGLFSRLLLTLGISSAVAVFLFFPLIRYGALGLLIMAGLVLSTFFVELRLRFYEAAGHFIFNLLDHLRGREIILPENALFLWLLLVGITALVTAVVVFRQYRTWLLLLVYGSCFLLYWYSHVDVAYPMLAVFLGLYIVLYSLKQYDRSEHTLHPSWQRSAVSYGLIIILLAIMLPKSGPLAEWHWLEARTVNRFPILTDLRGDFVYSRGFGRGDYFDFRLTGFQEDSSVLGGPVLPNDRLVMKVKAPEPLYLRGNIKTVYRDNGWHRGPVKTEIRSIGQHFPMEISDGDRLTLEITNVNFSSMTLFAPYQPVAVESLRNEEVWVDEHYQLSFPDAVYKNESYTVHAVIPSPGQQGGLASELWSRYLQLPETVTERVVELTGRITRRINDPADKALALQQYLRTQYAYSMEVLHTPPGQEFVDFFLFEMREGYCTYFATALAVMLRLEGIPSRYVEGYIMPRASVEGEYEIRQRHAHTWVEAYIDSAGWIILEATPAYEVPEMLGLMVSGSAATDGTDGDFDEFLLLTESIAQAQAATADREGQEKVPDVTEWDDDADLSEVQHFFQQIPAAMGLLLSALFLLFLARAGYQTLRFKAYQQRVRQLTVNRQAVHVYRNILELLKALGHPIEPGETPYEYARRISRHLYDMEHHVEDITEQYILARYSEMEITPEAIDRMEAYRHYIDQRVRYKRGIRQYLYLKYIRTDYMSMNL